MVSRNVQEFEFRRRALGSGRFLTRDAIERLRPVETLDFLTRPDDIAGIEIYHEPFVPPQFSRALRGCGSIVMWRLPPFVPHERASRKRRLVKAAALVGGSLLVGTAIRLAMR